MPTPAAKRAAGTAGCELGRCAFYTESPCPFFRGKLPNKYYFSVSVPRAGARPIAHPRTALRLYGVTKISPLRGEWSPQPSGHYKQWLVGSPYYDSPTWCQHLITLKKRSGTATVPLPSHTFRQLLAFKHGFQPLFFDEFGFHGAVLRINLQKIESGCKMAYV